MKTREAGRECAPVEPSSATSRNTSSPDMSPRSLARRSSPSDAPSTPRPGGEVADEPRTRRGSSHGERGGAFGRLQTFGRQVFEISSRVLTFRPYVAREPIKFVTPVRVETSFLFRPGHRANWSERAAARSDAPLARVRVGLDDAGIPCIFARRWGHAVVAGKPAEPSTGERRSDSAFGLKG